MLIVILRIFTRSGMNWIRPIAHHQKALRIWPNYFFAHYCLAEIYRTQGEHSDALDHFTTALNYKMEWDSPINKLISLLFKHKAYEFRHLERTIRVLEEINAEKLKRPNMVYGLSAAYYRAGRYEDAISMAKKAIKLAREEGQYQLAASIQENMELFNRAETMDINLRAH